MEISKIVIDNGSYAIVAMVIISAMLSVSSWRKGWDEHSIKIVGLVTISLVALVCLLVVDAQSSLISGFFALLGIAATHLGQGRIKGSKPLANKKSKDKNNSQDEVE